MSADSVTDLESVRGVLRELFSSDGPLIMMATLGVVGLTDDEYLWEPVENSWSVRPRSSQRTKADAYLPEGEWGLDIEYPDPSPAPFTTIAWRMTHMTGSMYIAGALLRGRRQPSGHIDETWPQHRSVAHTSAEAVERWNDALGEVQRRLADVSVSELSRCESHDWDWPPSEPGAGDPVWKQVLYFGYFEPASHAAEVRLIRDLHRHTNGGRTPLRPTRS